ncbi:uncharacterized protein LOC127286676 [Leptopilina boulardi]|uniref:uncharacterized protein LOC127286676 n=1 Tax=Leptopilina boulardi TaxID=63433 RepID=UPI0021F5B6C4|nr:uncharacterized protein LOC127286676 [Leptopilina boulardi]
MKFSKEGRFFPNECYVCKSTKNLIRCKCNMISYCGENHRLQHYSIHENFCNAVMELLNEKKVSHIYEELYPLLGKDWKDKRQQIYKELKTKLTRSLSPLEESMFDRPRVCYVCFQTNQERLKNCLECSIASFCTDCLYHEEHDKNCKLMQKYLNMLQTADVLNVNLQFLPTCFPFIRKNASITIDRLTHTMLLEFNDSKASASRSIKLKIILLNFIDAASIFHTALQKIQNIDSSEIIIHLDALDYKHVIVEKNYWEFLLHLNSDINILKIVITGCKYRSKFKNSLCKECYSMKKNLSIERYSMSYEEYILQENYQKPTALFYCKVENDENFQRTKEWIKVASPIVLPNLSKEYFYKYKSILEFSSAKFEIIYEGKINTPFSDKSTHENDDYILIFKLKGTKDFIKSQVDNSSTSGNNEIKISDNATDSNAKTVRNELLQENKTQDNIKFQEIKDKNINLSLFDFILDISPVENQTNSLSHQNNFDSNRETKDVKSLSASSSVSPFTIISETKTQKTKTFLNKDSKLDEKKSLLETHVNNSKSKEDDNKKIADEKVINKQNIDGETQKSEKESQLMEVNFLEKHISFLQTENNNLRQYLNLSKEENTKLRKEMLELEERCSNNTNENVIIRDENVRVREHLNLSIEQITLLKKKNLELEEICIKLIENNKLIKETTNIIDELEKKIS